jgi:site-specific recombinase XerD
MKEMMQHVVLCYSLYKQGTMPKQIYLSCAQEDLSAATWLESRLEAAGYRVSLNRAVFRDSAEWEQHISDAIQRSAVLVVLLSPESARSSAVEKECILARQTFRRPIVSLLVREIDPLPWYVHDLSPIDFQTQSNQAFSQLLAALPDASSSMTFGEARDAYLNRATLKSAHTLSSYRRAIELFLSFLKDRSNVYKLPIQEAYRQHPEETPLKALSQDDAPIFLRFAQWLLSPSSGNPADKRPYKPATVQLRIAGVQNWFKFLDDHGWLPADFKLAKAERIIRDELRSQPPRSGPPSPPEHIEEVIYYYDTLQPPKALQKPDVDPERIRRWELTRLRNRALLHTLAETGGRISEVLSLNLADFPERYLHKREVLRVEVLGKGGHTYYLRFFDSLPAIREYIHARGANLKANTSGDIPVFISHDPRYDGSRMSRIVAWRIAQRAARALGLHSITPHDFRHWRATQLINAGHSLDVVQDYLGHRSVETTRAYYAHTDPLRVDDAAKDTPLPNPNDPQD